MSAENAFQALAAAMRADHDSGDTYPDVVFIRTEFLDKRRWHSTFVDVYFHAPSDTYAGISYCEPATESQETDSNPELVAVEPDPTPRFRLKRKAE